MSETETPPTDVTRVTSEWTNLDETTAFHRNAPESEFAAVSR